MSTPRLVHSRSGYLRYMQMSKASLFALCEGKDLDPFFYGQICKCVCAQRGTIYEICKASELPPHAGGKTTLIEFYDYLRRKGCLVSTLGGKITRVVLFLDKDIDDLTKSRRRSAHVIYTRYYDVHNEIFRHGNLVRGTASAASLDEGVLSPTLANPVQWCAQTSRRWQDWIVLCLISAQYKVACQSNYRVRSRIQCPNTGVVDQALLNQEKTTMAAKLHLSSLALQRLYDQMYERIERFFKSGRHDHIFKGKWYPFLLDEDIRLLMGQNDFMKDGFTKRITSAVASTLDFSGSWKNYYTDRLRAVIDGV